MKLLPIKLPPGVFANGTEYDAKGRWRDANLVRFHQGTISPVGGWNALNAAFSAMSGTPRCAVGWKDNNNNRFVLVVTSTNVYATDGATLWDVTPASGWVAGANPGTIDLFGEIPVFSHGGAVFSWTPNTVGTAAAEIVTAPFSTAVAVTDERFLVSLNGRTVQWASQESLTDWTPSSTNSAGDLTVVSTGELIAAKRVRGELLLWTEVDVHRLRYVGAPLVYGVERVDNGGLISKYAVGVVDGLIAWMGPNGFYRFDGYVREIPCEVSDHVFGNINRGAQARAFCVPIAHKNEIWWFYPHGALATECNRYVAWNYAENHWSMGELERRAGFDANVWPYPVMVGGDGLIYEHEVLSTSAADKLPGTPYLTSGPMELGDGDRLVEVLGMIPAQTATCMADVTFWSRFYPRGAETMHGPYATTTGFTVKERVDLRFAGREIRMKIAFGNGSWGHLGVPRLEVQPGSRR